VAISCDLCLTGCSRQALNELYQNDIGSKFCMIEGAVYTSPWTGQGTINRQLHTTPEDDQDFLKVSNGEVNCTDGYSGRHSCRAYSQTRFNEARLKYGE